MTVDSRDADQALDHLPSRIVQRIATALTPRSEPWLVIGLPVICFLGIHFIRAALEARATPQLSTGDLLGTIALEASLALVLIPILRLRGWTLARVTRPIHGTDLFHAAGLLLAVYALTAACGLVLWTSASSTQIRHLIDSRVTVTALPPIIIVVSLLNPLFEEFLLVGYTITALRAGGGIAAASVSIGLRLLFHLYQGPIGLLSIAPFGVVLVFYYQRTRAIWPLVIAHGIQDLVGLFLARAL